MQTAEYQCRVSVQTQYDNPEFDQFRDQSISLVQSYVRVSVQSISSVQPVKNRGIEQQ